MIVNLGTHVFCLGEAFYTGATLLWEVTLPYMVSDNHIIDLGATLEIADIAHITIVTYYSIRRSVLSIRRRATGP